MAVKTPSEALQEMIEQAHYQGGLQFANSVIAALEQLEKEHVHPQANLGLVYLMRDKWAEMMSPEGA